MDSKKAVKLVEALFEKAREERPQDRGVHLVYSGMNEALRLAGFNPRRAVDAAVATGRFEVRPCRGGARIYRADEAPPTKGAALLEAVQKGA
jgi:hypothetical protein